MAERARPGPLDLVRILALAGLIFGCTPTIASELPTAVGPTATANGAPSLSVTGSGEFCGPWWQGCGAVLVVEQPGWSIPDGWRPSDRDTIFAIEPDLESPMATVRGVKRQGQASLETGVYEAVVIETTSPDDKPQGTLFAHVLCTATLDIPDGARSVTIAVTFGGTSFPCTAEVVLAGLAPSGASPSPSR
jgi:hypothetical protein